MSETRVLLAKISALRQRLEQAQGLSSEARSAVATLVESVQTGEEHDCALEEMVRPLTGARVVESEPPRILTQRARRVLERGRDLLGQLRQVAEIIPANEPDRGLLKPLYHDTVAMIDTALRTVALLPESATSQMQICRGLEVTLEEVAARLATITASCQHQRQEQEQIHRLAGVLSAMNAGSAVDSGHLYQIASEVLSESAYCMPLGFVASDPSDVAGYIATHSLMTARVVARIIRHDAELKNRTLEVVIAALVHDVGMLGLTADVLSSQGDLSTDDRRLVEAHAIVGAQMVTGLFPDSPWLAEGVAGHHERLDGTGYPDGLKGNRIRALARLLAVCDVYVALCSPRPYRQARSTRTAMADTLLLAEQGQLDHHYAECLLSLSFYPVGSVVELSNGSVGVVIATPGSRNDLNSPARPVVAVLTDGQGVSLPRAHHLDLAICDQVSIVRSLPAEQSGTMTQRFPRWVA